MHAKLSDNLQRLIIFLGVCLLFAPKINILSVAAGESAGIRIDDILIFIIFVLLVLGALLNHRYKISKIESIVFILIGYMLLLNVFNLLIYGRSSLFYSFRYLEYFVFFYIGQYFFIKGYSIYWLFLALLLVNGILMILQQFSIVGGFSSAGYIGDVLGRPIGLTGGPWEISAILNFCFAVLFFGANKFNGFVQKFTLFALITTLLLLTGSRVSALAHVVLIFYFYYIQSLNRAVFITKSVFVALVFAITVFLVPNPLSERSENIFSWSNIEHFMEEYAGASPIEENFGGFSEETVIFDQSLDVSWLFRIGHWAIAIKTWLNSLSNLIFGVGAGHWGFALDGGWLRVLTELGLLGTLIFLLFLYRTAEISCVMFAVVIALTINMLFIDIHIAYKVMSLFFFLTGYAYMQKNSHLKK